MANKSTNDEFKMFDGGKGKRANQKLKPYLVLQYLMKYSDENHVISAPNIVAYLQNCGVDAERRSVYKDIEEINKAMLIIEQEIDVEEAEEILAEDIDDEEKTIVYDKNKKGFYVRQRHYDFYDIRLLAECVYSAKFLAEGQAKRLADVVCEFVSEAQAQQIRHDAFLTDRVKTNNKSVINNIATINEAMSKEIDGAKHIPEKISFKYLKYSISDLNQQAERRHGATYKVSPFALLINDGNYYLLAFDDYYQELRTYRVDRMKSVNRTGEPRDGENVFLDIDLKSYTQRVFSMFGGEQQKVTIQFRNYLLDAVVDRFGTKGIQYFKVDDRHFKVTAPVEISDQFFSWVCGFGSKAKITYPEKVVSEFKEYLDKIRDMY